MGRCPGCGADNRQGRKFCAECGAALGAPACPSCGSANAPGEKFCGECGAALGDVARPAPVPVATTSEKKHITVLFADVAGSMDLQEGLEAEVWARIMGRFVSILAEGVRKFGGTVDKFTGDGIMALFGAPVAQEDHARRACLAARHLASTIGAYSEELRTGQGIELEVRLGLNSGEVVVGTVGDDVTLDPTALGHTVGLAQRMEAMARPGSACLTAHTARLVERSFELESLGATVVKGAREPMTVYVLGEPLASPSRHTVGAAPLVGRERELAVLEDALALAQEGRAQVVGIVGEPGVGKSRLCEEFARSVAARNISVRRAGGVSHGQDIPLLPILELLRDYFSVTDADGPAGARDKIAARMLALDPDLDEALPLVFDFLDVPDPDRPAPRLDPDVRLRRIFDTLRRLTQRRSEQETLVLVLEDLHWFDLQSRAFVERLLQSFPGTRTLVLTNFRPEFSAPWARHTYYRQLPVGLLGGDSLRLFLERLLGGDDSLAPVVELIARQTEGNPFFVEEVVRSLVEDGTLTGDPGDYRLVRPVETVGIPPSVQATLAARIDRLPVAQKRMLETAAVIGRSFTRPVLGRVLADVEDSIQDALDSLCAAELLAEMPDDVAGYRFWHPLTQEVAYQSLLGDRRRTLHAAVGAAIIAAEPDRLDERAALVASHFEQADDLHRAAAWNSRAAGWALRSDQHEAVRRWRRTVDLLGQGDPDDESRALGAFACARLLQFGSRTGLSDEEAALLVAEGRALSEGLADQRPLIAVTRFYTTVQLNHGQPAAALAGMLPLADVAEQNGDGALAAALWAGPAIIYSWTGPLDDGLRAADRVLELAGDHPDRGIEHLGYSPLTLATISRARMLAQMGRLAEAAVELDGAVALARRRSESELIAYALATMAPIADWIGVDNDALRHGLEAIQICEDLGNRMFHVPALHAVGLAHMLHGRLPDAVSAFGAALEVTRSHNAGRFEEAAILAHQARAYLNAGDFGEAETIAGQAVAVARHQKVAPAECLALITRAAVGRVIGHDTDSVAADLAAATALVDAIGALTYRPFIAEELGRLRDDEAQLKEAARLYEEIGAEGHARRLKAEYP